jgi:hypothetical protein
MSAQAPAAKRLSVRFIVSSVSVNVEARPFKSGAAFEALADKPFGYGAGRIHARERRRKASSRCPARIKRRLSMCRRGNKSGIRRQSGLAQIRTGALAITNAPE